MRSSTHSSVYSLSTVKEAPLQLRYIRGGLFTRRPITFAYFDGLPTTFAYFDGRPITFAYSLSRIIKRGAALTAFGGETEKNADKSKGFLKCGIRLCTSTLRTRGVYTVHISVVRGSKQTSEGGFISAGESVAGESVSGTKTPLPSPWRLPPPCPPSPSEAPPPAWTEAIEARP